VYIGRRITLSFSYVTDRGGWGDGKGKGEQDSKESVWACITENFFPLLISTQSVAFLYTDFCTTLYFVNQRNCKTLAMQAHALTRMRYFCSLNVIISHLIVLREGLGYLSVCAIASRSSPLTHACICNGHAGSEICCGHCTVTITLLFEDDDSIVLVRLRHQIRIIWRNCSQRKQWSLWCWLPSQTVGSRFSHSSTRWHLEDTATL
jgi:hypothetical protein